MLDNPRLMKLLYYNSRDALQQPNLKVEQKEEVLDKQIKLVPKIYVEEDLNTYIVINFDHFIPNYSNPEFRDNEIIFDIVCHVDSWLLNDFQLRPYKIAGELDYLFNNKRLTGIGKIEFMGSQQMTIADGYITISLFYRTVHGGEDQVGMLNPVDELQFNAEFDAAYNN